LDDLGIAAFTREIGNGNDQRATLFIPAAPASVRGILHQPLRIPAWNPAFLSVTGLDMAAARVLLGVRGSRPPAPEPPCRPGLDHHVPHGDTDTGPG
jgi:hypothetical protein